VESVELAFTTYGCLDWSWQQVLDGATRYGYRGLELRMHRTDPDLRRGEPLASGRYDEARRQLRERGLTVVSVGSSCRLHESRRDAGHLAHGRDCIDLAAALGAPFMRVFPDHLPEGPERAEALATVVGGLRELAQYASAHGVTVLLESHGTVVNGPVLAEILTRADHPAASFLWDTHHTWRLGGEAPAETWAHVAPWVRHCHVKDSVTDGDRWRYSLPGAGEYPWAELLGVLRAGGYGGYISYEHEMPGHPYLPPAQEAFPIFVSFWARLTA
jgi:sugar phosphate isomerase/epimerase